MCTMSIDDVPGDAQVKVLVSLTFPINSDRFCALLSPNRRIVFHILSDAPCIY